jgi:prepilin-type N-terminal cleavage/methylation domain-containing protein
MARKIASQAGFSFIEIMVAVVVLGIVISPVMSSIMFGKRSQIEMEKYVVAYNLADEKLETLKLLPFSKLESEDNDIITSSEAENSPDYGEFTKAYRERYGVEYSMFGEEYKDFVRTVKVDASLDTINKPPRMKRVIVEVKSRSAGKLLAQVGTLVVDY